MPPKGYLENIGAVMISRKTRLTVAVIVLQCSAIRFNMHMIHSYMYARHQKTEDKFSERFRFECGFWNTELLGPHSGFASGERGQTRRFY